MDTNSTSTSGDKSASGLDASITLAIVALVVSLVALFTTILQVLQQYLSTAGDGYRRCTRRVMGPWGDATYRRFRPSELRFEVIFETPVIFTSRPENAPGPILDRKIHQLNGSIESYASTRTEPPGSRRTEKGAVTDDERASWVLLLNTIQREEAESRMWETSYRNSSKGNQALFPHYSICHAVQKKQNSWDFMPSGINKPFATTNLSHLVEIVAMLGMSWTSFDIRLGDVQAEGNGFIISCTLIRGLGLVAHFAPTGPAKFTSSRVIPCLEIRDLAFGFIPSILKNPLEVGSTVRLKHTLMILSCDEETIDTYEIKRNRVNMFSVTFEIIAMLAQPFRIRYSMLRVLPNPTEERWLAGDNKINWSTALQAFHVQLAKYIDTVRSASAAPHDLTLQVADFGNQLQHNWKISIPASSLDLETREVIHDGLDLTENYFRDHMEMAEIISVAGDHVTSVSKTIHQLTSSVMRISGDPTEAYIEHYFQEILPKIKSQGLDQSMVARESRAAIWIALVFRMICWFLLHDFIEADVNIVPSQWRGSKMPVYID